MRVTGELDLATRGELFLACTARHHLSVAVELSELVFIDCCGYGGIVTARNVVEADGRMLTIRGAQGQPGRFLGLIAAFERQLRLVIEPAHHVNVSGLYASALPRNASLIQ